MLMESLMKSCTKKLQIDADPELITSDMIHFMQKNVKDFPGNSTLKFCIHHSRAKLNVGMASLEQGFEMNDEMANYLQQQSELEVKVEFT